MSSPYRGGLRILVCGDGDDFVRSIGRAMFGEAGPGNAAFPPASSPGPGQHPGSIAPGPDRRDFAPPAPLRIPDVAGGIEWDRHESGGRRYLVAAPSAHTRNSEAIFAAAAASHVAILVADARRGLTAQARRHALIARLAGVRRIVLAVDGIDPVGGSESAFDHIREDFEAFSRAASLPPFTAIPVSGNRGDNFTSRGTGFEWWHGPALLGHLDSLDVRGDTAETGGGCLPVRRVCRRTPGLPGVFGTVGAGTLSAGQSVTILPSGNSASIADLFAPGGRIGSARTGDAIVATLAGEVELARGDWLVGVNEASEIAAAEASDLLQISVVWMSDVPLTAGRSYLFRCGATERTATIVRIRHALDVATLARLAARTLEGGDIGECEIALDAPCPFYRHATAHTLNRFVMIDRPTGRMVAAGMIKFGLRRASNLVWQGFTVDKNSRADLKRQKACCLWLTGLSGSGKSTIGNLLEKRLHDMGRHTYLMDGDNVRHGLNRDLGFTPADRVENVRRLAEAGRLMVDAGLITIVASISPYRIDRDSARRLFDEGEFIEVFVDCPVEVCAKRDAKGLYAKALTGLIPNFTGVSAPYEEPLGAEIRLRTCEQSPEQLVDALVEALAARGIIEPASRRENS